VVERGGGQARDGVPPRVRRDDGVEPGADQAQISGRHAAGLRVGVRLQLLEVRELPHVHLRGEVAADGVLERLAGVESAARERPPSRGRRTRAAPEEHLEPPVAHLEHDRDGVVEQLAIVPGRFSLHSRKLAEELG
jgi:hypothetical protein